MKRKKIYIDGNAFSTLSEFYDEVERRLTRMDWIMGRNLHALYDVLRGGFEVHECYEPIEIEWKNAEKSSVDLGYEETIRYLEAKLHTCHPTAKGDVLNDIDAAKNGQGSTLFGMIVSMMREHEHISVKLLS